MAVRTIESGMVDTCMFPINFAACHYGGLGQEVLNAAIKNNVGVIALKYGARGRLTPDNKRGGSPRSRYFQAYTRMEA